MVFWNSAGWHSSYIERAREKLAHGGFDPEFGDNATLIMFFCEAGDLLQWDFHESLRLATKVVKGHNLGGNINLVHDH